LGLGAVLLAAMVWQGGPPAAQGAPAIGPVVDHTALASFYGLTAGEIAAAAALKVLFIDHSVGENINQGLNCYGSASVAAAPSFCKRFEHVDPALSARPEWFQFGSQYNRASWVYHAGGPSYWREWPAYVEGLLRQQPDWDVVIMMPSYLVAPNGGWAPFEDLESAHPDITFVYATSSLPRGVEGGTERELVMQRFNEDARAHALAHGKPFLDVADLLSHDYIGGACFDTRDGKPYCRAAGDCEDLPDDGVDIPAICQHYTSEFYGGHLGNVSGGMLRMAQSMWLLMARLAGAAPPATPTPGPPSATPGPGSPSPTLPTPAATATATATSATVTPSVPPTSATPRVTPSPPFTPGPALYLPWAEKRLRY
jgi:hypothetical protein